MTLLNPGEDTFRPQHEVLIEHLPTKGLDRGRTANLLTQVPRGDSVQAGASLSSTDTALAEVFTLPQPVAHACLSYDMNLFNLLNKSGW